MSAVTELAATLELLIVHDLDYPVRYGLVLRALHQAHEAGYPAGLSWDHNPDPELDGYRPLVYIELPAPGGQLAWHMPEHGRPWDGHTTAEKHDRIRAWARSHGGVEATRSES